MRHPSKVGGFCARYMRRGMSYEMAKQMAQSKALTTMLRKEALEKERLEKEALEQL